SQVLEVEDFTRAATANFNVKNRLTSLKTHIRKANISLRVLTIGDNLAVFDLANQGLNFRMVKAHDAETIEGNILNELTEGCAHGIKITVVIKMLRVDIGHHSDIGWQFQECTI